jgi:outer membrane lipoprotein-sorting protein
MSIFDRRPGLRWAVPAGAAVVLVGGAALAPMAATADSGLAPRTAEELLVALAQPSTTAVAGTVQTSADLGLPDLPMGMMPSSGPMALASGESTVRVWTDGPDRQRLAMIERAAETTVVRNGQQAWVWSSADATADRYVLPERDGAGGVPDSSELPPGVQLPSTPQEAAAMALEAIDPTTEVTTSGVGTVAGRDAYELTLTPRDPQTLVARVALSMDAETNVPLRVRVYSTSMPDPAFEVGFRSVDYSTPDPSLFDFTPPPGATVTEHDAADMGVRGTGGTADLPQGPEPTIVGEGWSTVVISQLPVDSLADLAEDGMRSSSDDWDRGGDPAATALALIEALPAESGAWGTGRVLRGTLFSVILTDDGRVALGAVSPEALGDALAAQ